MITGGNITIESKEKQPPKLERKNYPIKAENADRYAKGISENTLEMMISGQGRAEISFEVGFSKVQEKESSQWIGYAIKSLPMNDWRSFVEDGYIFTFDYRSDGLSHIRLEFTNLQPRCKPYIQTLELKNSWETFTLDMIHFKGQEDQWSTIGEVCFVFFPQECIGEKGGVEIKNLELKKVV